MFVKTGNISELGVKGFNLYRCQLLGVQVPEFWIIPTDHYRRSLSNDLDSNFLCNLKQLFWDINCNLAVRSSCVAEDLKNKSNAGRFKTVLNVDSPQKLINAVQAVWRSAKGNDMAVIIQKQIDPEISGVLFSRNPLNGKLETVIEYVKGFGNRLVSGKATPKKVVIDNKKTLETFKHLEHYKRPLKQLIKTSKYIEVQFNYPLDIEWAISHGYLYILQVRPITNLPVPQNRSERTYSRVPAEQFYSGPVSPLFYSIFEYMYSKYYINSTMETLGINIKIENILIKFRNYLYIDTTFSQTLYSNLPIKNPEFLKVFPKDIRQELLKKYTQVNPIFLYKIFTFLLKNPKYLIWNLDIYFTEHVVPTIIRDLENMPDFSTMDEQQLKDALNELFQIANKHILTSKWGLSLYIVPLLNALERLLDRNDLDKSTIQILISNLDINKTLDASLELNKLGKMIIEDPRACSIIQEDLKSYSGYRSKLETFQTGELIIDHFEFILKKYGHRRLSRDILAPSWKDEPMIPFSILQKMVTQNGSRDPIMRGLIQENKRNTIQKLYQNLGFKDRIKLRILLRYLNRYIGFREYQRFYLDMIISKMRELVLEISKRMIQERIFSDITDVFYLDLLDLNRFLSGHQLINIKNKIEFNKVTFINERSTPGKYLRGGVDFDSIKNRDFEIKNNDTPNSCAKTITGQPVSSGRFRGRARVVDHIDDKLKLQKNEVLVTSSIDPGQTHAFLLAGALILEVGGVLSHGAILAREFNIPTVANVRSATTFFRDGQEVVVDGTRGEIVVLHQCQSNEVIG